MALFPQTTARYVDPALDLREDIEIAVVKALSVLRRDKGGPAGMIREYAGELERWTDEVTEDQIKAAVGGQIPGILVTASSTRYESVSVDRMRYRGSLDLDILYVAASLRSEPARERGAAGVFRLMGHARALLAGIDLGTPGCSAFQLLAEEPMLHTKSICVWKQTISCVVNAVNDPKSDAKPYTQLWSMGSVPEIAGVGDALAFAASSVTLTDAAGGFDRGLLGLSIVIAGATSPANNGTFAITDIPDAGGGTQIVFANTGGVTETFNGTWTIKRATPLITAKHL